MYTDEVSNYSEYGHPFFNGLIIALPDYNDVTTGLSQYEQNRLVAYTI
jgi:hypothetical protein